MRKELSKRQQQILDFIKQEIITKNFPPSIREIGKAVGLRSSSSVHGHLTKLEEYGYIRRDSTKPRAIEIIDEDGENQNSIKFQSTVMIPVLGDVTAGAPILANENYSDSFPVPNDFINDSNEYFILNVEGESMINAGIFDGDYVLIEKNNTAHDGDIIVALVDEDSATVKRFYKEKNVIRLQPENDFMDPIYSKDVKILGKVRGVFRKM